MTVAQAFPRSLRRLDGLVRPPVCCSSDVCAHANVTGQRRDGLRGFRQAEDTIMHGHQRDNQVGSLDEDETIRTASGTTVPQVNCEAFPPTSQHLKDKRATGR